MMNYSPKQDLLELTPTPSLSHTLIGREKELMELQQIFRKKQTTVLLNGLGGIGKSSLARFFLQREKEQYNTVAWVSFEENLEISIVNALNPHFQFHGDHKVIYHLILSALQDLPGKTLLVFDNFNQFSETRKLKKEFRNFSVLLTSRLELNFLTVKVGILSFQKASELFSKYCSQALEVSQLKKLFELIGYHTLMIELLSKTYHQGELEFDTLLELFSVKKYSEKSSVEKKIFSHLSALFEHTSLDSDEIFLLKQFSTLASTEQLSTEELFDILRIQKRKRSSYLESLNQLFRKGWLQKYNSSFYCHEVIQNFILHSPMVPTLKECKETISYFTQELSEEKNYQASEKSSLLSHATSILTAFSSRKPFSEAPEISLLSEHIGKTYRLLGQSEKAIGYIEKSLQNELQTYGEKHPRIAILWSALGETWKSLGEYQKALEYHEQALQLDLQLYPSEHSSVARDWHKIGVTWFWLGNYEKALEFQEKSLAINLQVYGAQHPKVAEVWNDLALVWEGLGEYEKGLEFQQKTLESNLKTYGKENAVVAINWNNLGLMSNRLGKYEKALRFFQKALDIALKIYGPQHPQVGLHWNNLGTASRGIGNYESALTFYQKALEISLKIYGKQHPQTALAWNGMGVVWDKMQNAQEALHYSQNALSSNLKTFGSEHPLVALNRSNVGKALGSCGEHEQGILLIQQALETTIKIYGEQHPEVAACWNHLGIVLGYQKKYKEAISNLQKALAIFYQTYGKEHPQIAQVKIALGKIFEASHQYSKANEYYHQGLILNQNLLGEDHPETLNVQRMLKSLSKQE